MQDYLEVNKYIDVEVIIFQSLNNIIIAFYFHKTEQCFLIMILLSIQFILNEKLGSCPWWFFSACCLVDFFNRAYLLSKEGCQMRGKNDTMGVRMSIQETYLYDQKLYLSLGKQQQYVLMRVCDLSSYRQLASFTVPCMKSLKCFNMKSALNAIRQMLCQRCNIKIILLEIPCWGSQSQGSLVLQQGMSD